MEKSSNSKTELKKFSQCHYYWIKYYNYYQYNPSGAKRVRLGFLITLTVIFLYGLDLLILKLFPEIDMVLHSRCSHPFAGWNGKFFSYTIWPTEFQTRSTIYNLHFAKQYDDLMVVPPNNPKIKSTTRPPRLKGANLIPGCVTQPREDLRHLRHSPDGREERMNISNSSLSRTNHRTIVLFGSHHKTGSYLAKKLFAKLCSSFRLCCQFHVTRDSLYSVYHTVEEERVHILGHYQWIWYPYELNLPNSRGERLPTNYPLQKRTEIKKVEKQHTVPFSHEQSPTTIATKTTPHTSIDYKFVHFYRHPFQKIISSYFYHLAGSEVWTQKKTLLFHQICPTLERLFAQYEIITPTTNRKTQKDCIRSLLYGPIAFPTTAAHRSSATLDPDCRYNSFRSLSRNDTFDYCETIYLCETCCRKEHESLFSQEEYSAIPVIDPSFQQLVESPSEVHHYPYQIRQLSEYQFLCQYLGQSIPQNHSVQQVLQESSLIEGLLLEAALNYYEILRMAKIVNYTWIDPKSFNVNLDILTHSYDSTVKELLHHLEEEILTDWTADPTTSSASKVMDSLVQELSYYNLKHSWLYRWSMSNPLHNHITNEHAHRQDPEDEKSYREEQSRFGHQDDGSKSQSSSSLRASKHQATWSLGPHKSVGRSDLFDILANHPVVAKMYAPIFELMNQALH